MSRPLLLIVDGESSRTPGLVSAMEGDGWAVRWIRSEEAQSFHASTPLPDLVLLDPSVPGSAGYALARRLREQRPHLPVLALAEGSSPGAGPQGQPMEIQAFLDPAQPNEVIAASLRRFRPAEAKLTVDEIFGDLLVELEQPPVPPPADPFAMFAQPAAPAVPPPPGPLLSTTDIFGSVLAEVEAPPQVPDPGKVPPPTAPASSDQGTHSLPQAAPGEADGQHPSHFTLSGIAGVDDPFAWTATSVLPTPKSAPPPPPRADVTGAPEPLEEYGNYYLLEKIAVGGMAELFKAQQRGVQGFQKIVAIKRILPNY
ncbi:MAG: hypothetical protein P4L11_04490, partial [Geothrix sp.]|nr:hypothetical protein [Geothrix sp.]